MSQTLGQFVRQLEQYGLLAADDVMRLLAEVPDGERPQTASALRDLLLQRGQITKYQLQQITAGKGHGLTLGNYVILDKVGQGGMGLVYKARHLRIRRVVALKLLPAELVKDQNSIHRFHREVQAAARLLHPNIVTAYDASESQGTHFLVMEYVDGSDLSTLVKRRGPLPFSTAIDCVLQAGRGLAYAHSQGVIHRDIKPANVLRGRDGVVKVLDMGLARIENDDSEAAQSELTTTGTVMGTVDYMPPEQALNTKHASHLSDQYSLGVTLFYLLAGRPPFTGESVMEKLLAHRDAPIPSLRSVCPEATAEADAVFRRMLAKRPEDRFPTMSECLAALEGVMSGNSVAAPPLTSPPGEPESDGHLRSFLSGLDGDSTLTPTVALPTAVGPPFDSADGVTVVTSGVSDTDLRGSSATIQQTLGAAPLAVIGAGSSSGIQVARSRRPWWTHPALWMTGLAGLFCVALIGMLRSGGSDGVANPRPLTKTASSIPASPATSNPVRSTQESPEQVVSWVLANQGRMATGPSGALQSINSLSEWRDARSEITWLEFPGHAAVTDDDLSRLKVFRSLHTLSLVGCPITDKGAARFGAFPHLASLNLSGTQVTDEGLKYLDHLQSLQLLSLGGTQVHGPGLRHLLRFRDLNWLSLSGLDIPDEALRPLTALRGLRSLELANCQKLTDACGILLAQLPLESLSLQSTPIGDPCLLQLREIESLKVLDVAFSRVTPAGLISLAEERSLTSVDFRGISTTADESATLRRHWPEAHLAGDSTIPPVYSNLLAQVAAGDFSARGVWRLVGGALLTPPAEPDQVHLLKLPSPGRPADYELFVHVERLPSARLRGLGLILALDGHQALLVMDGDNPRGWRLTSIADWPGPTNGFDSDPELTRIRSASNQIQVAVRHIPSGLIELRAMLNGRLAWSLEVDPADLSLPEEARIADWDGLGLASWDEFRIYGITIQPLTPYDDFSIDSPLVTGIYPEMPESGVSLVERLTSPGWEWSPPENLGPRVNDARNQLTPWLSRGGLELTYQTSGPIELLTHRRPALDQPWRPAQRIPTPTATFGQPCLSEDGCTLYAGRGETPHWQSPHSIVRLQRSAADAPWGDWVSLFPEVESEPWGEKSPVLSADGLELYVQSDRPGGMGDWDLWVRRRADSNSPWSEAVPLGEVVNSPQTEAPCSVSPDGRVLLFCSNRPGGSGDQDLWMSIRSDANSPWESPVPLEPTINTPGKERSGVLIGDGSAILFCTTGLPGYGGSDLFLSRRVPKNRAQ